MFYCYLKRENKTSVLTFWPFVRNQLGKKEMKQRTVQQAEGKPGGMQIRCQNPGVLVGRSTPQQEYSMGVGGGRAVLRLSMDSLSNIRTRETAS